MNRPGDPPFDVAISFLARDEGMALWFREKLSDGLTVFVYSKQQEQLAGTEGLESLRNAFRSAARVVVVLYRDGWGETPWTRVEKTAITDRALKEGWDFLLFVTLERTSSLPKWLPETRIRLCLPEYGIDQAVGAIKARVQEQGGIIHRLDAVARARLAADRVEQQRETDSMLLEFGGSSARAEFAAVEKEMSRLAGRIQQDASTLGLTYGATGQTVVTTTGPASMNLYGEWFSRKPKLIARFWLGRIRLPQEEGHRMTTREAEEHGRVEFDFDRRPGLGWCWVSRENGDAFASADLAERLLFQFVAFAERVARGELQHSEDQDD